MNTVPSNTHIIRTDWYFGREAGGIQNINIFVESMIFFGKGGGGGGGGEIPVLKCSWTYYIDHCTIYTDLIERGGMLFTHVRLLYKISRKERGSTL